MAATSYPRPDPTKLYGICHVVGSGAPVIRTPRSVKVGIGLPKGKDLYVYIDAAGKWVVKVGDTPNRFDTMEQARIFYRKAKDNAPMVNYPRKLAHIVFTRPAADGTFDPDWETTAAHGSMPREIDIMFTDNFPLQAQYAMWSSSECKCSGDGVNALRVLSMAQTKEEKELAKQAEAAGERHFPIMNGCWTRDCAYSKPGIRETAKGPREDPAPCKPHGRLSFQLLAAPRLGASAQFDTTSIRSISQLFSCLQIFRKFTGRGDETQGFVAGIPLKFCLAPFKVNHNGQPSTAYAVSLEFRTPDALQLKDKLLERAFQWNNENKPQIAERRQIQASTAAAVETEEEEEFDTPSEAEEAAAIDAEFHDDGEPHHDAVIEEAEPEDAVALDAARNSAIQQVSAKSGYTVEQVAKHIDAPDSVDRCRKEFGEPPNEPQGKREKSTAKPVEPKQEPPQQETLIPETKPEPVPAEAPRRKIQFGKR